MQTDNQLIRRIKKKQDKKAAYLLVRRFFHRNLAKFLLNPVDMMFAIPGKL